ncbi:hypothetical protein C0J50_12955, partial [Silurus asotus]
YQLKNMARMKSFLTSRDMETVIHAFISPRLDYCNVLYLDVSQSLLSRLQLQFHQQTERLLDTQTDRPPSYLRDLIASRTAPRCLRSSSTAHSGTPSLRMRGRYTSRLFYVLAPRWWNELPLDVRTAESLGIFKRQLKTLIF